MFQCKYKFELEDSITCAKYVYKSQRRKRDVVIAFLIPILLVIMVALLVYDIISKRSIVLDVIMIVAIAVLQVLYLLIPIMLVSSQKKSYKKQNLKDMDYLLVQINDNLCTETMFKDGQEYAKNIHNLKTLTSYFEDATRITLIFNKIEFVCIKKANLEGDINKLKNVLNKAMYKSNQNKS